MQTSQNTEYAIRTCAPFGRSVEEADVVRADNELTHTGQGWPHLVVGRTAGVGTADATFTGHA